MPRTKLIITLERDVPAPGGEGFTRLRAQRLLILEEMRSYRHPALAIDEAIAHLETTIEAATPQPA